MALVNNKLKPSFTITNSTEISMIYFCSQYVLLLLIESAALLHSDGSTNKTKMLDDPVTTGPVDINNPTMSYGSSKSAKIVLSKSMFYVKNRQIFFKKKSFKNINLGDHFL